MSAEGERRSVFARPFPQEAFAGAVIAPFELAQEPRYLPVAEGQSLQAMIDHAVTMGDLSPALAASKSLSVLVGGVEVPRDHWRWVTPKAGALILVRVRPQGGKGGKSILRLVLTIAVAALAAWVSGGALAPLLGSAFEAGALGASLAGALVGIAGNMLINAIAPVPQPEQLTRTSSYTISGSRNAIKPFEACTLTIGRHRVAGTYAARPFTRVYDDKVVLYGVVQWHVGKCQIGELKVGDTPAANYQWFDVQHRLLGEPYWDKIDLVPNVVIERQESVEIRRESGWIARRFPPKAFRISFDIGLPGGLFEQDEGEYDDFGVDFDIEYKLVSSSTWLPVPINASPHMQSPGYAEIRAKTFNALRRTFEWEPDTGPGDYEFRIRRLKVDDDSTDVSDDTFLVCLRGDRAEAPVAHDDLCVTAFRIIATDQINGIIDELNAIVEPIIPERDEDGDWTLETTSRNPAAWLRWLHTGPAISPAKRLAPSKFDGSLEVFHDYCVDRGLTVDHVVDYGPSVDGLAQLIASAGNAHIGWSRGKRSIVIDDVKPPTQLFTAANVRGFRGSIAYLDPVHALRIAYRDAEDGYRPAELIVYADGYGPHNATNFEAAEIPGKVTGGDVWRTGRRLLKRAEIRREEASFEIAWEHLVTQFGQRGLVQHYALNRETQSGWVEAQVTASGDVIGCVLDEVVTFEPGKTYVIRIRRVSDGGVVEHALVNPAGVTAVSTDTVAFVGPAAPDATPSAGDLYAWGEADTVTFDGSIIDIAAGEGDRAQVTCVAYSDALFSDDETVAGFLLEEGGDFLLQEDSGRLLMGY